MNDVVVAAVYDPQPVGGTSGPIRYVAHNTLANLDARGLPYALIAGDGIGIGGQTHHVVDGLVQPLDGAPPIAPTVLPPPSR